MFGCEWAEWFQSWLSGGSPGGCSSSTLVDEEGKEPPVAVVGVPSLVPRLWCLSLEGGDRSLRFLPPERLGDSCMSSCLSSSFSSAFMASISAAEAVSAGSWDSRLISKCLVRSWKLLLKLSHSLWIETSTCVMRELKSSTVASLDWRFITRFSSLLMRSVYAVFGGVDAATDA